jgi:glutamyl/glutaminyl-tRNA synthetase
MSKAEIEKQRELAMKRAIARNSGKDPDVEAPLDPLLIPGPYRNTSVETNLKLFEDMRQGKMDAGKCTLRLKMDFDSSNPNLHDLMAYRLVVDCLYLAIFLLLFVCSAFISI